MNSSTGIPLRTWTFLKTTSDICGFWSGPFWPAAATRPSRNTVIVTMAPRIVRLHPNFMSSPFRACIKYGVASPILASGPPASLCWYTGFAGLLDGHWPVPPRLARLRLELLFGKARRLGPACDKQRFVRCPGLGDSRQRAPRLHGLASVSFKDHFLAGQEILRSPTLSTHGVRAGQLQVPIGHVTVGICHIDVHAHMRIHPFNLRHHAGQFDLLVGVILRIESVVGNDRNRQAKKADAGHQDAELRSHSNTSRKEFLAVAALYERCTKFSDET